MQQFHRNFRDNLRVTPRSLLFALVVVGALMVILVAA